MTLTSVAFRNVAWNTISTLDVAVVSGITAWTLNKVAHFFFNVKPEFKKTPSFFIRQVAFLGGAAVGFYVLQKTSVDTIRLDSIFVKAHGLSIVMGLFWSASAALIACKENASASVIFGSIGTLILSTPFVAHYGQNALLPALAIGAGLGSYL